MPRADDPPQTHAQPPFPHDFPSRHALDLPGHMLLGHASRRGQTGTTPFCIFEAERTHTRPTPHYLYPFWTPHKPTLHPISLAGFPPTHHLQLGQFPPSSTAPVTQLPHGCFQTATLHGTGYPRQTPVRSHYYLHYRPGSHTWARPPPRPLAPPGHPKYLPGIAAGRFHH